MVSQVRSLSSKKVSDTIEIGSSSGCSQRPAHALVVHALVVDALVVDALVVDALGEREYG